MAASKAKLAQRRRRRNESKKAKELGLTPPVASGQKKHPITIEDSPEHSSGEINQSNNAPPLFLASNAQDNEDELSIYQEDEFEEFNQANDIVQYMQDVIDCLCNPTS